MKVRTIALRPDELAPEQAVARASARRAMPPTTRRAGRPMGPASGDPPPALKRTECGRGGGEGRRTRGPTSGRGVRRRPDDRPGPQRRGGAGEIDGAVSAIARLVAAALTAPGRAHRSGSAVATSTTGSTGCGRGRRARTAAVAGASAAWAVSEPGARRASRKANPSARTRRRTGSVRAPRRPPQRAVPPARVDR